MSQSNFYRGVERAAAALATATGATPEARARAVHDALAPLLATTARANDHACRSGCSHCCHLPVGITFGEAVRLADAVRTSARLVEQLAAAATDTAMLPWRDLVGVPCPLLDHDACAVHDARPLPCRSLASTDAASCARGLAGTGHVAVDDESYWLGLGAADVLANAGPAAGTRELRAAVHAVLHARDDHAAAFLAARPAGA